MMKKFVFVVELSVPIDDEPTAKKVNGILLTAIYHAVKNLKLFGLTHKKDFKVTRIWEENNAKSEKISSI